MTAMLRDRLPSASKPIPRPALMRLFLSRSGSAAVAGAVGKVEIAPLLRDFQAKWESPAVGLFQRSDFFHGPFTHK
jgi:hypothetical protein